MAIDLRRKCRLCLKNLKSHKLIDIFTNDYNCSLPIRIKACSGLEVHENDALPRNICKKCRQRLEKFYLFKKKLINADTKLRRHLRLVNAGKNSNVFEDDVNDDVDDTDEYEQSMANAQWENEHEVDEAEPNQKDAKKVKQTDSPELEQIIPLVFSSTIKVIPNTSCTEIMPDREGTQCTVIEKYDKSTKIAVAAIDDLDKTCYIGNQENSNDSDNRKRTEEMMIPEMIHEKKPRKKSGQCCEYCSKWFSCRSTLLRHVRSHTGEKPFVCEECGKAYGYKDNFKRHLMIHPGEKPNQCTICLKSFILRGLLEQHINSQHSNGPINLHQCQQCSKAFRFKSGLYRHKLVHTGRKFKCEFCATEFNDKISMRKHVALIHAETLKIETLPTGNDAPKS